MERQQNGMLIIDGPCEEAQRQSRGEVAISNQRSPRSFPSLAMTKKQSHFLVCL